MATLALADDIDALHDKARRLPTDWPDLARSGIGDVLISWENEAYLAVKELGPDKVRAGHAVAVHPGRAAGGGGGQDR